MLLSRFHTPLILLVFAGLGFETAAGEAGSDRFFRFRWQPVSTASVYELQLTRRPKFDGQAIQMQSARPMTTLRLAPGQYLWRVRARDEQGRAGDWSPIRRIKFDAPPPVKPTPPQPTPEAQPEAAKPVVKTTKKPVEQAVQPAPAKEQARIRQRFDEKTGWESYSIPKGKVLKVIFETSDQGAGSDKVLIKVNDRDFQTYPDDRLLLEHDGRYHIASYAVDRVGNRSILRRRKILIDSTPPGIRTAVQRGRLVIDADDPGVGVKAIEWRRDGQGPWRVYDGPIRPGAEDIVPFEIRATDHLDNTATTTFTFAKNTP